jgi:hypothetical protein
VRFETIYAQRSSRSPSSSIWGMGAPVSIWGALRHSVIHGLISLPTPRQPHRVPVVRCDCWLTSGILTPEYTECTDFQGRGSYMYQPPICVFCVFCGSFSACTDQCSSEVGLNTRTTELQRHFRSIFTIGQLRERWQKIFYHTDLANKVLSIFYVLLHRFSVLYASNRNQKFIWLSLAW